MNRLALALGSAATLAAFVAAGVAFAQGTFAVAPIEATLFVQDGGQCRGHITYAITLADDDIADDVGVELASIEVRAGCARLQALAQDEVFDTKGGKLEIVVRGARVYVLPEDPDGPPRDENGDGDTLDPGELNPRKAGECNVDVHARVRPVDATQGRVFRGRDLPPRTKAAPQCAPLTNLITNSCVVARGAWPADVALPIATCAP